MVPQDFFSAEVSEFIRRYFDTRRALDTYVVVDVELRQITCLKTIEEYAFIEHIIQYK